MHKYPTRSLNMELVSVSIFKLNRFCVASVFYRFQTNQKQHITFWMLSLPASITTTNAFKCNVFFNIALFVSGVTLSREEDDCIWVYNRSENPIFVNSLTLEDPNSPSPTRVPAEHCLCVYDPAKAAQQHFEWQNIYPQMGPIDPKSIRISFVKGWGGQRYSRKEITACPCWLEILLAPCR